MKEKTHFGEQPTLKLYGRTGIEGGMATVYAVVNMSQTSSSRNDDSSLTVTIGRSSQTRDISPHGFADPRAETIPK